MKRTGSIGSAVPPALTTMCQPARSAERVAPCAADGRRVRLPDRAAGDRRRSRPPRGAAARRGGRRPPGPRPAGRRPGPRSCSRTRAAAPRCRRWPDGRTCRRPWPGPRPPVRRVARQVAVMTSSARPLAMAPSQRAVAGATSTASAASAATMWLMRRSACSSSGSSMTGRPESVSSVSGPMKCGGGAAHHDLHLGAGGDELAQQLGGLVGGDRAGDAEQDEASLEWSVGHGGAPAPWSGGDVLGQQAEAAQHELRVEHVGDGGQARAGRLGTRPRRAQARGRVAAGRRRPGALPGPAEGGSIEADLAGEALAHARRPAHGRRPGGR